MLFGHHCVASPDACSGSGYSCRTIQLVQKLWITHETTESIIMIMINQDSKGRVVKSHSAAMSEPYLFQAVTVWTGVNVPNVVWMEQPLFIVWYVRVIPFWNPCILLTPVDLIRKSFIRRIYISSKWIMLRVNFWERDKVCMHFNTWSRWNGILQEITKNLKQCRFIRNDWLLKTLEAYWEQTRLLKAIYLVAYSLTLYCGINA